MEKIEYVLLALTLLSLVLHSLKSRTASKADDVAAEVVDATKDAVEKHYAKAPGKPAK